jgi:putative ABC transport system permease protein
MIWLKRIFSRRRINAELSEEIREHLNEKIEELVASGMLREDATHAARRQFGNLTLTEENSREAWRWPSLEDFFMDVRHGLRTLRKNPGFTTVAVLTLALGIGVNAAIFGLVDSALLHALPFHEPERLVHVWTTDAGGDLHTPLPREYAALRKYSQAFEQIAGTGWVDNFYGNDESGWENLPGLLVSSNWLSTLGIQPYLGRNFLDEEQAAGRDAVVILSYGCWRTRFHADPSIVGKQIVLNRVVVTVVGVLPHSLGTYYQNVEIIAPIVLESYESTGTLRVGGSARVQIVARLKPGVTLEQARAETEGIAAGLRSPGDPNDRSGHLVVEDFGEMLRHPGPTMQNERRGLWLMAVAAGVVLLIACANVASLLLARGVKRQKEVAVRSAVGCSRGRMIRQLLTESTLLFLCGGTLGLLAARWSEEIITKAASGLISNAAYLEVNVRVLGVGLGVSLFSALIFGIIPALQMTRVNLTESLKDAVSKVTSGVRFRRPRNLLVVFQIALGMMLIVGFGLLLRSLLHVESAPLGFDPHNVLTATVSLPMSRYSDPSAKARVMNAAVEQVRSIPGVESAAITDSLPMDGADSLRLKIETPLSRAAPIEEGIWFVSASPEYFSTLKIPILAGRPFQERDIRGASPVVIVNQTFANVYFPGANAIGYHLAFPDSSTNWREIVGVVSDFRQRNPEEDLRPLVYLPVAQTLPGRWSMVIRMRASSDIASGAHSITNSLQPVDPQLYWKIGSMQQQIYNSESLTLRRPIITLLALFGGLALVLIVIGVFGVTSYSVAERTREIGIRVALGAAGREVLGLVLRESLGITLAGLSLGSLGAFGLARFLPTGPIGWSGSGIFLYGVSRTDMLTYSFAVVLLTAVVLVASWAPARRATQVDPMVALRYE